MPRSSSRSAIWSLSSTVRETSSDWHPSRSVPQECVVEGPHRKLPIFRVDHHRYFYLRRRYHLNVHTFLGQHAEHPSRDASVGAHADAHDRDLGDLILMADAD